ncbi:MAG TPA: ATP-binding protein [Pantanalinema sp.]
MAGQFVDWAYGRFQEPADEARIFAIWAGLTLVANLTGFASAPVARWLCDRFSALRSGAAAWLTLYGVFGLSLAALMGGRSVAGHLWLPEVFHLKAATVAALNGFMITMILFAVAERSAAGDRDSLDHKARLLRLSEELTRSKAQLVAEDDRMRAEVARMLHGELQTLLLLSWAELGEGMAQRENDRSAYESKLGQVEQRLGRAAEVLDSGLAGWLGSIEDAGDLFVALEHLVASFAPILHVRLELDPRLKESGAALPPAATRAALRLVQEALLNALKHARAREVRVVGEPGPQGGIALRVTDDGRGLGAARMRRGLGFSVLGKELEAHGGTWDVSSAPGRGTSLQVSLPIARAGA